MRRRRRAARAAVRVGTRRRTATSAKSDATTQPATTAIPTSMGAVPARATHRRFTAGAGRAMRGPWSRTRTSPSTTPQTPPSRGFHGPLRPRRRHYPFAGAHRLAGPGLPERTPCTAPVRPGMRVLDVATGERARRARGAGPRHRPGDPRRSLTRAPACCAKPDVPAVPRGVRRRRRPAPPTARSTFSAWASRCATSATWVDVRRVPPGAASGRDTAGARDPRPSSALGYRVAKAYMQQVVPFVTRLGTRDDGAEMMMRYYWHTIDACVPPQSILDAMDCALAAHGAAQDVLRPVQRVPRSAAVSRDAAWPARGARVAVDLGGERREVFVRTGGNGGCCTLLHRLPDVVVRLAPAVDALAGEHPCRARLPRLRRPDKPAEHVYSIHEQADLTERGGSCTASSGRRCSCTTRRVGRAGAARPPARRHARCRDRRAVFLNGGLFPELHRPQPGQLLLLDPETGPQIGKIMNADTFGRSLLPTFSPGHPPSAEDLADAWASVERRWRSRRRASADPHPRPRTAPRPMRVEALEKSDLPRSFVWGMLDPVSGAHMAERIASGLPDAELIRRLGDVGHWPQLEAPDEVTAHLRRLLRLTAARRGRRFAPRPPSHRVRRSRLRPRAAGDRGEKMDPNAKKTALRMIPYGLYVPDREGRRRRRRGDGQLGHAGVVRRRWSWSASGRPRTRTP